MNYPMWGVPAAGLAIACVAILHVFVSHFAIGGGLFLVLTERKARRDGDAALLSYVRTHSRFFAVLTLVLGAITGVGVWFTIGLVHPQATASLINTFVWLWAVEWTMFATEIAASMVYYYGWDRLDARTHQRVGWIYVWAAWLSLVVINGILSFMLTPGAWLTSRRVLDGFLNPTNLPSMAGRTFAAVGLAGVYALLTASWLKDRDLKARVARYAGLRWIAPMAVALPLSLVWYLSAASSSGVPVREILGSRGDGLGAQTIALFSATTFGYPIARHAAAAGLVGSALALLLTLAIVWLRPRSFGPLAAGAVMAAGFVAVGGAEWTREDLRKPYVIGQVHVRQWHPRPPGPGVPARTAEARAALDADRFTIDALNRSGVLGASPWVRVDPIGPDSGGSAAAILRSSARGAEVFRLECARCHTVDGYLAIRPLVAGRSASTLGGIIGQLAKPENAAGRPASWGDPVLRVATWRGRRMPPFAGTSGERDDLAIYLARLGGQTEEALAAQSAAATDAGQSYFEEHCAACHGPESDWPMPARVRGRTAEQLYDLLGRLPSLNDAMPAFEGTDDQRRAVAAYVATLGTGARDKEGRR